jgi:hypothetical protein
VNLCKHFKLLFFSLEEGLFINIAIQAASKLFGVLVVKTRMRVAMFKPSSKELFNREIYATAVKNFGAKLQIKGRN